MTSFEIFEDLCKLQEKAAIDVNNARNNYDYSKNNRNYFAAMVTIQEDIYKAITKNIDTFYKTYLESEIK